MILLLSVAQVGVSIAVLWCVAHGNAVSRQVDKFADSPLEIRDTVIPNTEPDSVLHNADLLFGM